MWPTSSQLDTNIIKTSSGLIQGVSTYFQDSRIDQYLGVPFAEPPIGLLRFQKPQPVKPWNGILLANKPGPACVQMSITRIPGTTCTALKVKTVCT